MSLMQNKRRHYSSVESDDGSEFDQSSVPLKTTEFLLVRTFFFSEIGLA